MENLDLLVKELRAVNVELRVYLAQEATCRTHILHNKMAYTGNNFAVIVRQHIAKGRFAQSNGYEIQCCFHRFYIFSRVYVFLPRT